MRLQKLHIKPGYKRSIRLQKVHTSYKSSILRLQKLPIEVTKAPIHLSLYLSISLSLYLSISLSLYLSISLSLYLSISLSLYLSISLSLYLSISLSLYLSISLSLSLYLSISISLSLSLYLYIYIYIYYLQTCMFQRLRLISAALYIPRYMMTRI